MILYITDLFSDYNLDNNFGDSLYYLLRGATASNIDNSKYFDMTSFAAPP